MPLTLHCSSCGLGFSVGSYHGQVGEWFNALYCRHCGSSYSLEQTTEQFLDGFSREKSARTQWKYQLRGPKQILELGLSNDSVPPMLECQVCGAKGPFGTRGPITDEMPEGLAAEAPFLAFMDRDAIGICPRCKNKTMKVTDEWIT